MRKKLTVLLALVIALGLSTNYVLATETDNSVAQIDAHANCDCNGEFEWYDETLTPEMIEQMETQVRDGLREFYENGGDAVIERILNETKTSEVIEMDGVDSGYSDGISDGGYWIETDDDGMVMLLDSEVHAIGPNPFKRVYTCKSHYYSGMFCIVDVHDHYYCITANHTDIVAKEIAKGLSLNYH